MTEVLRPAASLGLPPDVPQPAKAVAAEQPEFEYWWYCIHENHPGVPTYSSQPLNVDRIFGTHSDQGCPTCPKCQREVSAVPCAGPLMPPVEVVEYHRNFAQQQLTGGIGR